MTRENQTAIIVFVLIVMGALAFVLYQRHEDAEAIRTDDYDRCWTGKCRTATALNFSS